LVRYHAYLADPENVRSSAVLIKTPDGKVMDIGDPALLAEIKKLASRDVYLLQNYGGVFDCADVSLITDRTLTSLGAVIGEELDVRRFRPNIASRRPRRPPSPKIDGWAES
jgi:hypothetical protein